ncbi:MAG: hypothetical protein ACWGQW_08820 [bacterium]
MGFDYATLEQQLQLIQDLKLQILNQGLPGIQQPASWRVGEVTFSKGGTGAKTWLTLPDLIDAEKTLMEMMRTMFPTEFTVTRQQNITPFGEDLTDYENLEDL